MSNHWQSLAERLRPTKSEHFIGQSHLLGEGQVLYKMMHLKHLYSMVLWGPPGVGKTSLVKVLAEQCQAHFVPISAVLSGVKIIRQAIENAEKIKMVDHTQTVLFVDEVHRLNKAQQDLFLPFIENGAITFIGATTENPSFALNNALLSRARVYVLKSLVEEDLNRLIDVALTDPRGGINEFNIEINLKHRQALIDIADGDARRLLHLVELAVSLAEKNDAQLIITDAIIQLLQQGTYRKFDRNGDIFYEQISALHKSVRGSSPDGALYWMVRMIDGGCDPLYIARRLVRIASEDIGNADPRALSIALHAWEAFEKLGSPEGELVLAQALIYLACAPKSNAVYEAYNEAVELVKSSPAYDVPLHLRNAPTAMMKNLQYGDGYRYAHIEPEAYAAGENYFPESIAKKKFYKPVPRGLEIKIKEKLQALQEKDDQSPTQRYSNE